LEISVAKQSLDFLFSAAFGFALGFLYDIFRLLRKKIPTNRFFCIVEDTLFWILSTIATLLFIFVTNAGEIRVFIFLGVLLGAVLYFLSLSPLFLFVATGVLDVLIRILLFVFSVLLWPLKKIFTPLFAGIKNLTKKFINLFKFEIKKVIIMISGKKGFGKKKKKAGNVSRKKKKRETVRKA